VAAHLDPGDVVLVRGELGTGKTTLVRGACRALGVEEPGLLEDYLTPERIAFVEWPEAAEPGLGAVRARVVLEHRGGDHRSVSVTW
jgi:tRNA threonylcarbamoyladenosine biosynthesis protein TsaE